ncbi:MAG TPA: nitroreductase family deazaflavin-dependent oxidoreductase [Pseudonocardiaceae bacterium]
MSESTRVEDSPVGWVHDHIKRYVESGGEDGYTWRGATTLLLTTVGRKSGVPRRTALIYQPDGDNYVVVASRGGAPTHPAWYLNLTANPEVTVQVKDDTFAARARTASAEERPRLWKLMAEIWPAYDDYQKKTDREIPVVVLEPVRTGA